MPGFVLTCSDAQNVHIVQWWKAVFVMMSH